MKGAWICATVCGAAIVAVSPAVIGAYMARHPIAAACRIECHWVIPPEEFRPGGEFYAPPGVGIPPGRADQVPNTAPWPPMTPLIMTPPGVVEVVETEDENSPHECRRLHGKKCRYRVVETPEPSSALAFLVGVLVLIGVRTAKLPLATPREIL